VSGGQTGVDRGALDAALVAGFSCGGWCPADRGAEDGVIPDRYPLMPLPGATGMGMDPTARQIAEQYRARTLKNIETSDGTVILFSGSLSGGTLLTQKLCVREQKPLIALDALATKKLRAAETITRFVEEHGIQVLNVAGPRLSGWPAGYTFALGVIGIVISNASIADGD
jgi:Circularly permutated YpsA SLOG family